MEILKEMPRRDPINGTFELTVRCNLKCKMCLFRHDDSENKEIMAKEKTAEEWIDMARQVAEAGTFNLLITGGEPLLRSDFAKIYEDIYKLGFMITLYTNATLVDKKIMDLFRKYPPHKIGVTLYGASYKTYEKVCGNGKAFEKAIRGIEMLSTLPSVLEFRTTIIKDNYGDIDMIEDLIHDKFGQDYKLTHTRMVTKGVRGAASDVESCRLSPKDNINLFFRRSIKIVKDIMGEEEFNSAKGKFDIKEVKNKLENELDTKDKKITLLGCNSGMESYTISWDGKLLGCQLLDAFFTEPFEEGFKNAWDRFPYTVTLPKINSQCMNCENAQLCSTCYAIRLAETGKLDGCPKYLCEDTKELMKFL